MKSANNDGCPLDPALQRMLQASVDHPAADIHQLAETLCLSPHTVHTYFKRVNQALETHSQREAIVLGFQQGWLVPPPAKMKIDDWRKYVQNVPAWGLA